MKKLEKILKALANQKRLEIIGYIKEKKSANVGEIHEKIKITFKATSKHLAILSAVSILDKHKKGLEVFYSLAEDQNQVTKYVLGQL